MTALLIVGHGTRDAEGAQDFRAFVQRVARRAPQAVAAVDGGFIELSAPAVGEAVTRLVQAGHPRVAAVPLVLVAAGHAKGDIPGSLNRERLRHPGLSFAYGRPLGVHPTILSLLEARLNTVLPQEERADAAVLLVGRGSTDPDANAEVYRAARLLWEGRGIGMVETAFVSLAHPSVVEGLERCRRLGAKRIVVLPYFLFRGVLPDRIVEEAAGYDVAPVIGDCDELADLVLERHAEAVAGDIRMNCDTCVYRIAMPGFEHKVGAGQEPHHHPDEDGHSHHHTHAHSHG
ncbi:sirohydrochlorin chelatase [Catenulispora pinisilvae]|uniref:sirohydrochlorin chelatase n=1 Tax=Catenulispora pinisilvae TaxID=2705253 RepID=UPI001891D606|nr:sirohydrochlorin chelatase [Catenulispora pinisilvae]